MHVRVVVGLFVVQAAGARQGREMRGSKANRLLWRHGSEQSRSREQMVRDTSLSAS